MTKVKDEVYLYRKYVIECRACRWSEWTVLPRDQAADIARRHICPLEE